MNRRQLDTVLAALRAWQRDMRDGAYIRPEFIDMACESSGIGGELTASEIDDLCEELNCSGDITNGIVFNCDGGEHDWRASPMQAWDVCAICGVRSDEEETTDA